MARRRNYRPIQSASRTDTRQPIVLELPRSATLGGPAVSPGSIRVFPGGKPPKRRFRTGVFFRKNGALFQVMYAYRLLDTPNVWWYYCEPRQSVGPVEPRDRLEAWSTAIRRDNDEVPAEVTCLFKSSADADRYYANRQTGRDGYLFTAQDLAHCELVSSGEVLDADETAPPASPDQRALEA